MLVENISISLSSLSAMTWDMSRLYLSKTIMQSTTIKNWYLVNFEGAPEPVELLWGIIELDPSGRWRPGNYVCTSPVLEKRSDGVFVTKNTEYHTIGKGATVTMPMAAIVQLRMGYSPDEIKGLKDIESKGYKVTL